MSKIGENSIWQWVCCYSRIEDCFCLWYGITFGNDVLIVWSNIIIDTNFYPLYNIEKEGFEKAYGEIKIGENNCFFVHCFVMHSVSTLPNVVFGARTIVVRNDYKSSCLYGGSLTRKLKSNVKRIVGKDTIDNYK